MVSMGHFVKQVKGIFNETTFAVPVYKGVGKRTTVLQASFDNLGMKVFGSKWGMAPHTKLEFMEMVRDKHSSPFWPKSIR